MGKSTRIIVDTKVGKANHDKVFNKIEKKGAYQLSTIDFSPGTCLRKMVQLLKIVEGLNFDTLIYNDRKEFLVNVVNDRNAIILKNIRENIETIRLMCNMDRVHRSRAQKREQSTNFDILDFNLPANRSLSDEKHTEVEQEVEITTIPPLSELNNSSHLSCDQLGKMSLELQNSNPGFKPIDIAELESVLADTAEFLESVLPLTPKTHSSDSQVSTLQTNEYKNHSEKIKITEMKSVVLNDVTLDQTTNDPVVKVTLSDIIQTSILSDVEFSKVILSTPNNYTGAELFTFPDFNYLSVDPVSNQGYLHEIMQY